MFSNPTVGEAGQASILVSHFLSTEGWSSRLEVWVTAWVASLKTVARYPGACLKSLSPCTRALKLCVYTLSLEGRRPYRGHRTEPSWGLLTGKWKV